VSTVAELIQIAESLLARTREGALTWGTNDNCGDDEYYAETDRFGYYVGSRDNDGESPYRVEIWRTRPDEEDIKLLDAVTVNDYFDAQPAVKALVEAARQNLAGLRLSLLEEVEADLMKKTPF